MNSIRMTLAASGRKRGESPYMILLIISTVALALAVFFPTFEYFTLYKGEPVAYKFDPGASVKTNVPARTSRPAAATDEPSTEPGAEPAPAPAQDTGAITAPEPVEEPAAGEAPTSYNSIGRGPMAKKAVYQGPIKAH